MEGKTCEQKLTVKVVIVMNPCSHPSASVRIWYLRSPGKKYSVSGRDSQDAEQQHWRSPRQRLIGVKPICNVFQPKWLRLRAIRDSLFNPKFLHPPVRGLVAEQQQFRQTCHPPLPHVHMQHHRPRQISVCLRNLVEVVRRHVQFGERLPLGHHL
eukprot:3306633-Rhodomonas_salina.1